MVTKDCYVERALERLTVTTMMLCCNSTNVVLVKTRFGGSFAVSALWKSQSRNRGQGFSENLKPVQIQMAMSAYVRVGQSLGDWCG